MVPAAWSHPLGNYSINQYFLLDMRETPPAIFYLVDMAEIPSFTELDLLDTDFDSQVTDEEIETYMNLKTPPLLANLSLHVDGSEVALELRDRQLALLAGQGGMVIFNVLLKLEPKAWPSVSPPFEIEVESKNYAGESGVRECMLVLDNHYRDDTRSLGEERLKYQTLVFLDENRNPVYQDFDAQFEVRLAVAEGEPITGENATRIAFEWTSTAKSAKEMGEEELVEAFGETVDGAAPAPGNTNPRTEAQPPPNDPRQPNGTGRSNEISAPAAEQTTPPATAPSGTEGNGLAIAALTVLAILAATAIGYIIGQRRPR
jgi:hypothetical protein